MASDGAGNYYVAGSYATPFVLGSIQLPPVMQGTDSFLARLDANGQVTWAQSLYGSGSVTIADLIVDASGDPVVLGAFGTDGTRQGSVLVGNQTFALTSDNIGTGWLFLARFDATGTPQWVDTLYDDDNPVSDTLYQTTARLAPGPNGDIEVLAPITGNAALRFGANQSSDCAQGASCNVLPSLIPSTANVYLLDVSSGGTLVGYFTVGCGSQATVDALATSPASGIPITYLAAHCTSPTLPATNSVDAGANPRGMSITPDSSGGFILKVNEIAVGSLVADVSAGVSVNALVGDPSGDVYDAQTTTPFLVERRSSLSLVATWSRQGTKSTGTSNATVLTLDGAGDVIGAGRCSGFVSLDPLGTDGDVTCAGFLFAAYSKNGGNFVWDRTYPLTLAGLFEQNDEVGIVGAPGRGVFFGATVSASTTPDGGALATTGDDIVMGLLNF